MWASQPFRDEAGGEERRGETFVLGLSIDFPC